MKPQIIIRMVKILELHSWHINPSEAKILQLQLAGQVCQHAEYVKPRFIGGVDISAPDVTGVARAAVVIMTFPELHVAEIKTAEDRLNLPYIPGLLSFREAPLILAACRQLSINPDLLIIDGHGIAHPRRFGIASHLGLLLDTPTIGCAKSRLCGTHAPVIEKIGAYVELIDNGEIIGVALRSKTGARPIYVSVGHRIDLPMSIKWVMNCCRGYRLPEPSRLAHLAASNKSLTKSSKQNLRTGQIR